MAGLGGGIRPQSTTEFKLAKQKRGGMRGSLVLGLLVAATLLAWFLFGHAPFASEITVYQAWCPSARNAAGVCNSGEEAANPVTYKASPDTQTVVYWFKGGAPSSMTHCAIRDARNWSCNKDSPYATSMVNGELTYSSVLGQPFYQVPKYKWYWLWLQTKHP